MERYTQEFVRLCGNKSETLVRNSNTHTLLHDWTDIKVFVIQARQSDPGS